MNRMSHLFLAPDRPAEWKRLLRQADATALSLRQALLDRLPEGPGEANESDRALHQICVAWLEGDRDLADLGAASLLRLQAGEHPKDLGKASQSLAMVLAWDFGKDLWTAPRRREVVDRLVAIACSFLNLSADNPHAVTNNWWMLTHGGCLLACLAAHGEEGSEGVVDLAAMRDWALGRFRAFCVHFGSAGLYHEGSGYIGYTLSMLMPMLVALRNRLGLDLTEEFPELRRSIPSMLVGTAAFQALSDTGDTDSGASLQWNDAGRGCASPNPLLPGILVAPEAWRGGLRTIFDRLVGVDGPANWNWNGLTVDDVTLPRLLQKAGYRTIEIGKGHFGPHDSQGGDPRNLGFDINIAGGAWGSPATYFGEKNYGNASAAAAGEGVENGSIGRRDQADEIAHQGNGLDRGMKASLSALGCARLGAVEEAGGGAATIGGPVSNGIGC
jgi:hypothetical protein